MSNEQDRQQYIKAVSTVLGHDHPFNNLQHAHDDIVGDHDCEGWTIEWLKWLLTIPHDKSPLVHVPENPFDSHMKTENLYQKYQRMNFVLFLASSTYGHGGYEGSAYFTQVPKGKNHIFAAPFIAYASTLEYLGKSEDELYAMLTRSVDSIYKLDASLDGMGLTACRVEIKPEDNVTITGIPPKNVLGIPHDEISTGDPVKILAYGYVIFLQPMHAGLHRFSYKAYAPAYNLEANIQLNVRGSNSQ